MGFTWKDETATAKIGVKVPTVENGKLVDKRVVFHFSFDPSEYIETMQSAAQGLDSGTVRERMEAGYLACFDRHCSGVEGDGIEGSLEERTRLVRSVKALRRAAVRAAEILFARLQIEEAELEGPLPASES